MLLSRKTIIQLNEIESNIVGHMNYAAYKLWNVCNYERKSIPTGMLRNQVIKMICGLKLCHLRLHRKYVNYWISHGSLFIV